ncbi:MAG: DUF475 domain-containing protein [Thiothrix sp.]|nr:DUF475 domain-containing protein [Thiothrix sp.]HPQ96799.1 DUF475 domain-containing protein [Thiolinea sp.]
MSTIFQHFRWPFLVTLLGLLLSGWLGWVTTGTLAGVASFLLIGIILAGLEISLSFDNAIVNANILKNMEPVWQRRFLTWGILIAVFGMRIIFPLAVVSIAAGIGPWEAVMLALHQPDEYARIMDEAHLSVTAFGGTFLMMVGLSYFIDSDKKIDWIEVLERRLRRLASLRGLEIALVLAIVLGFAHALPEAKRADFLMAAIMGLLTFTLLELLEHALDHSGDVMKAGAGGGLGAFLYLEVLDASFSFDGVIGAFALTKNLFLIAIGLGIGAMYVRAMTIMLVERQTLAQFRYLEHGAFYSITVLAFVMFAQSLVHVPEVVTGLVGGGLILMALYSSARYNRRQTAAH